ncbi:NAD+ synthase [Aliidongia dinghuensis]|uniref:Glutamine-dependent NAD(+) synthetase n=1 Tax=Aliidongia dinghuensis TaxID=1867774 RepID=A0A8J2YT32_9PROT|nr:NAD+ synthase [Aliidongia dinghuensis]GGF17901.1 NAD+ synthase [Aliidongia dinghuensis]
MLIEPKLRLSFIQANPTVGAIAENFEIVRAYRRKFTGRADLLVFSECFGTGYPFQDLALRPTFIRDFQAALAALVAEMRGDAGPAVLIGGPQPGASLPYNAAFLIETDGSTNVVLKHRLPNDEVYDEKRTFAEGPMPAPVAFRGFKLGIQICEDFWHGEVARALADEGADILISPNGSHFKLGKQAIRLDLARRAVRAVGLPLVYVNQVGGQDELVFDGGSFAIDRHGNTVAQVAFREASFDLVLERGEHGPDIRRADVIGSTANGYPEPLEALYRAMVLGLRDYVGKNRFPGVVIGMSGGLDSALSAAVAVDALGPDKVHLVRMPSPYTSKASMDDAAEAARLLGVRLDTVPIEPAMAAFRTMLAPLFEGRAEDVTEENIQARARGITLMAISNKLGSMVLSTGNKSEMSVGYATLYGDMCGGYSVLKDVFKTMVFALARWRNAYRPEGLPDGLRGPEGPVVPEEIITKPPSAELKPDQTDEAALGAYEHLDTVLRHLVEGMNDAPRAAALASAELGTPIDVAYAERIGRLVWHAEYKRRQGPMGVVLSGRGYDKGWRLPVTNAYGL